LLGYAAGARSIFLDAKSGKAEFGIETDSRIVIDPSQNKAIIQSGNYKVGESGMLIDFSTPEIKFGSGKFEVSPEGHIHAAGGGDIAGWQLDNNALYKGGVRISSDNDDPKNKAIQVINNNINNEKPVFSIDYRGFLHSERGDIAGWTIESDKLYNSNIGIAPKDWVTGTFIDTDSKGKKVEKNLYTGVFWAGAPDLTNKITDDANGHIFLKRNFFVT
jgi:hypothetical protein